jgi:polysaccharide transporter, PST family
LIKKIFKKASSNELLKTGFLVGIANFIKLITSFVINKALAKYVGDEGYAKIGQYKNFIEISNLLASGGADSGVVKYTAEYSDEEKKIKPFLSSSLKFTIITSLLFGLAILISAKFLAVHILYIPEYTYLIRLFGITVLLFALNTYLMSVLNGFGEVKKYTGAKISGSILSLILTGGLSYLYGLKGALIALTINQAVLFFITAIFVAKSKWFSIKLFLQKIQLPHIRNLFKYTFITLLSGILNYVVIMGIRTYIIEHGSFEQASYWDGMSYLSLMYIGLITETIRVYFLPKYSKLKGDYNIKTEIFKGYKIILPLLLFAFTIIFFLRNFIIDVVYTPEFAPMSELFLPKLIADFFQMGSWMIAYIMVAKAMVTKLLYTQVIFTGLNFGLSVLFFNHWGIVGVVWGTVIRYILYTIFMVILFRSILFSKKPE